MTNLAKLHSRLSQRRFRKIGSPAGAFQTLPLAVHGIREVLMRFKLSACFILPLVLFSAPAFAEGFRGDVHAGIDDVRSDGDSQTGATYGISLGVDAQRRNLLIGLQLDLDASDNTACETGIIVAGDRACISAKRDSALSLRLGRKIGGRTALYATIGYANARFEASYKVSGGITSAHETIDGVRLGVGVIGDFGRGFYAKAEYRYTNYENSVTRNQGLIGLGIRF
jgi:outer membrane immunogenic protein